MEARRNLDKAVRRAFQHILYLGQGTESDHSRVDQAIMFEQESESALDGSVVWKALVRSGKTFDVSAFDARALLHNLTDADYGRPLDEVRDLFWSAPRMPLLPGGDSDLQRAVFEALEARKLRLVGADGLDRVVDRPGDIGVGQSSLRLAKPRTEPSRGDDAGEGSSGEGTFGDGGGSGSDEAGTGGNDTGAEASEQEVAFTLMTSLTDDGKRESVRLLLRNLATAIDEGNASYAQLSVRVIVNTSVADGIAGDIRAAGANPMTKKI